MTVGALSILLPPFLVLLLQPTQVVSKPREDEAVVEPFDLNGQNFSNMSTMEPSTMEPINLEGEHATTSDTLNDMKKMNVKFYEDFGPMDLGEMDLNSTLQYRRSFDFDDEFLDDLVEMGWENGYDDLPNLKQWYTFYFESLLELESAFIKWEHYDIIEVIEMPEAHPKSPGQIRHISHDVKRYLRGDRKLQTTPNFQDAQGYLNAAPEGIGEISSKKQC
jgi:hypothetical protein